MGRVVGIDRPAVIDQRKVDLSKNEGDLDLGDNAVYRSANCFAFQKGCGRWL